MQTKNYFRNFFQGMLALVLVAASQVLLPAAGMPDYSKEAAIIEKLATQVQFAPDGARDWRQTFSIRIQSEAAIRQYGVLALFYSADNEQAQVEYVRVRKPDGSVVETPATSIQDVATQVAAIAPTYSDLRQKQIPVRALGVGDLLEYSFHTSQRAPEIAGQFWFDQYFIDKQVVLKQLLEVKLPKDKYIQVSSPKLKFTVHDEADQRIYLWEHSHLEPSKPDAKDATEDEMPTARISSFRTWEAVGTWWASLAAPQASFNPAIQNKTRELTAGLSSDLEKAKAIYNYVSLKFRYISISLGAGRYRPHSAAEVFANQYGDCKDKHILFVAMLKAAGIPAWSALIGAGIKFDESFPSPAQFNHVITVLSQNGKYVWLDTTAEVAPFGLLSQSIRDEEALVMPEQGKPVLMKTPADPPFPSSEVLDVKASLSREGTLTGRFDFDAISDSALALRSAFRQLAPAQWQAITQQLSYSLGFGGDVSGVDIANLENPDKPFHYNYDYTRKNYSDWAEHKIILPIPSLRFGPGDEAEKPKDSFWAGSPGVTTYRASLQLPKGFSMEVPANTSLSTAFADYSSHYSLQNGTLTAERRLTFKKSKVTIAEWKDYQAFYKAVQNDDSSFLLLSAQNTSVKAASLDSPEAAKLLERAGAAMQSGRMDELSDLAAQVERINPKQSRLWLLRGIIAMKAGKIDEAIVALRREIEYHPDQIPAYQTLAAIFVQLNRRDEAINTYQEALAREPDNDITAGNLAGLLMRSKRYGEIPTVLEKKPLLLIRKNSNYKRQG